MNKFTKEIFDGIFYIRKNVLKNIGLMVLVLMISTLMFINQDTIINSKYETSVELLLLGYFLLMSYAFLVWATFTQFTGYFMLVALIKFVGQLTSNYELLNFSNQFLVVGLIINSVYLVGDLIDEIKKARKSTSDNYCKPKAKRFIKK